jgi:hypothetical protein
MGYLVELSTNRFVDDGMIVAMNIAPHAANTIEIPSPFRIEQPTTLGAFDEERFVLSHLCERVPNVMTIPQSNIIEAIEMVHKTTLFQGDGRSVYLPAEQILNRFNHFGDNKHCHLNCDSTIR